MTGHIYQIINTINRKSYIGYTKRFYERMYEHNTHPFEQNDKLYNVILYNAIRKYGINNFIVRILEQPEIEELGKREKYWVKFYSTNGCNGYNMTDGDDGGDTLSNHPNKKEIQQKKSKSLTGKKRSKEACDNISNSLKGLCTKEYWIKKYGKEEWNIRSKKIAENRNLTAEKNRSRYGKRNPQYTELDDQLIANLRKQQLSWRKIAKVVNSSPDTVKNHFMTFTNRQINIV